MSETRLRPALKGKELVLAIVRWILIIFFAVYTLFPLIWLVISSLKTNFEFLAQSPFSLPAKPQWSNYINATAVVQLYQCTDCRRARAHAPKLRVCRPSGNTAERRYCQHERLLHLPLPLPRQGKDLHTLHSRHPRPAQCPDGPLLCHHQQARAL